MSLMRGMMLAVAEVLWHARIAGPAALVARQ
jgi:hypothetical protein